MNPDESEFINFLDKCGIRWSYMGNYYHIDMSRDNVSITKKHDNLLPYLEKHSGFLWKWTDEKSIGVCFEVEE